MKPLNVLLKLTLISNNLWLFDCKCGSSHPKLRNLVGLAKEIIYSFKKVISQRLEITRVFKSAYTLQHQSVLKHSVLVGQTGDPGQGFLLSSTKKWAYRGGSQLKTRCGKPVGSGVKVLHPGAHAELRSSSHTRSKAVQVVFPYKTVTIQFYFNSFPSVFKAVLKELQFCINFITLVLANSQASQVYESESH